MLPKALEFKAIYHKFAFSLYLIQGSPDFLHRGPVHCPSDSWGSRPPPATPPSPIMSPPLLQHHITDATPRLQTNLPECPGNPGGQAMAATAPPERIRPAEQCRMPTQQRARAVCARRSPLGLGALGATKWSGGARSGSGGSRAAGVQPVCLGQSRGCPSFFHPSPASFTLALAGLELLRDPGLTSHSPTCSWCVRLVGKRGEREGCVHAWQQMLMVEPTLLPPPGGVGEQLTVRIRCLGCTLGTPDLI